MNRRRFLTLTGSLAGAAFAGTCYGFFEAGWIAIDERTITVPNLPESFRGTRIAFLTDIHHGPYTDIAYLQSIVRTVNLARPDLILHGGDFSLRDPKYIGPAFDMLAELRAPMGSFGVFGNHDYWHGERQTREGFARAGIVELTNRGTALTRGGGTLWLAGVDDLWAGTPDATRALAGMPPNAACILLSHNPDVAETLGDRRVGLMLSGHTHGGQAVFPGGAAPFVPSHYGTKYLRGLVRAPETQVFISRGLGTAMVPMRIASRPEINLITLV